METLEAKVINAEIAYYEDLRDKSEYSISMANQACKRARQCGLNVANRVHAESLNTEQFNKDFDDTESAIEYYAQDEVTGDESNGVTPTDLIHLVAQQAFQELVK